ncbi:hypothetical protein KI387_027454, partial [Taxus chinensis]
MAARCLLSLGKKNDKVGNASIHNELEHQKEAANCIRKDIKAIRKDIKAIKGKLNYLRNTKADKDNQNWTVMEGKLEKVENKCNLIADGFILQAALLKSIVKDLKTKDRKAIIRDSDRKKENEKRDQYLKDIIELSAQMFHPVVGGGANGSVIHYSRNDRQIKEGEMVLMDVGCEMYGYVSDLTRTWPPYGRFSPAQQELYELILDTANDCLKLCKPGVSLNEIHAHSVQLLSK